MTTKLTVRTVEALQPGARDVIVWDNELAGFGLKVTPKGRRTYILFYRTADGQQRKPTLGDPRQMPPEAARKLAKRLLAEVAAGGDPSHARAEARKVPTVALLCDRYLTEYAVCRKKASSAAGDRRLIAKRIVPAFGTRKATSVTRADVAKLHHALADTPYEANRTLALCSKMFALAERWGIRPDGSNPATNIDRYREEKRERFLSLAEISALGRALSSDDALRKASPSALAAIRLLLMTGRRLGEVLSLEWSFVDLDAGIMRLPDTKTGKLTVPLSPSVVELLRGWRAVGLDARWVFPGARQGKHLVNLQKPWRAIRKLASLEDVRIHDLRHSYASVAAGQGMSLPMIGRLLGHTQPQTTARYAHLGADPTRAAANAIGLEIEALLRTSNKPLDPVA